MLSYYEFIKGLIHLLVMALIMLLPLNDQIQ